jgi:TolB protein
MRIPRLSPLFTTATALLAVAALVAVYAAWAQQPPAAPPTPPAPAPGQDITVVLQGHQRPLIKLAFPRLAGAGLSGAAAEAGAQLETTLRADLADARIFEIQGPEALAALTLSGDPAADNLQYQSLGNEILLTGELKQEGDRLVLEGRLVDLKSGQAIVGKRYRSQFNLARRVAHTLADEIVLFFTGRRGVALTTIAFYSDRDGGAKEIFLMDADGANQRRITGHKSISMSPAWRGADALAYVSFFDGPPGIYLVDLASGRKSPLINEGSLNISPSYSADGRRIAFARSLSGNTEIFSADAGGGNLRRLTHSAGIDTNPAWSPSGREIAFTSSRAGNPHIYVMDAEGANVRRITFSGEYNDGAAWRADGTQIAYASRRRNAFDIAVTDLVTLESRTVTSGGGSKESPTFSPDGRRIAFAWRTGGSQQIFVMGSDGTEPRKLTSQGDNFGPDWSGYSEPAPAAQ